MQTELQSARRDWEAGYRRLLAESEDPVLRERLFRQVEVVIEELRRRVGSTFTLAALAAAYADADAWMRLTLAERAGAPDWPRTLALVGDAAFHLYARGAVDYEP